MPSPPQQSSQPSQPSQVPGPCCFLWKYGTCDPPRGHCRFRHDMTDDGKTPCCFGPTCRLGHAARAFPQEDSLLRDGSKAATATDRKAFWQAYNVEVDNTCYRQGDAPAQRDATLLQSQLEPWSTAALRQRLATVFEEPYRALDGLTRGQTMQLLLQRYEESGRLPRTVVRVQGTAVPPTLCQQLLLELQRWKQRHGATNNTRPSIQATAYQILRSPQEFTSKPQQSKRAQSAAKRLAQNQHLWDLATQALAAVDPHFADNFSALAVTYNFQGSPHIDKQNTTPFYGLALGNFNSSQPNDGAGCVCVEVDAFTVCHVDTKHRLAKVDGRYPHWVAPYDTTNGQERYSLIYYSTWQTYQTPTQAYFETIVDADEKEEDRSNQPEGL